MSSEETGTTSSLKAGFTAIGEHARTLPDTPGVYRMIGAAGQILYVGKARSLKKRVLNYTRPAGLPERTLRMIALTRTMEFIHTHTEAEALLLESNLIKKLMPPYNILLRDDKSFPYILITGDHDFPLLTRHRGARNRKGQYFGPFASAGDVSRTLNTLQKAFMLRNCTNEMFESRTRPCLQYHIKRCTAPCVGLVSREDYAAQVGEAADFLEGRSQAIQGRLAAAMQKASEAMDYETAARYRDRLKALSGVQARQDINIQDINDADVIAMAQQAGKTCIQVFFFRGGQNFGNRSHFPVHDPAESPATITAAFIAQFYQDHPAPREILISEQLEPHECDVLQQALSSLSPHNVKITAPQRGTRRSVIDFAFKNAAASLELHMASRQSMKKLYQGIADLFGLDTPPERIEVYDNSHLSGTLMVGAMIVAGPDGFRKNAYRKFNMREARAGDDYGMMREMLTRRFVKGVQAIDENEKTTPDILLIDGGKGQLSAATQALDALGIADQPLLVAIAKGEERNAGRETFFMNGGREFTLPPGDPVLHYLQTLRDEAHRFAIGSQRKRREIEARSSPLDDVQGIGGARKKALLHHFGSARAVAGAGITDLMRVEGISESMARRIYDHFH